MIKSCDQETVELEWKPAEKDGGAVIQKYVLEKMNVADGEWKTVGGGRGWGVEDGGWGRGIGSGRRWVGEGDREWKTVGRGGGWGVEDDGWGRGMGSGRRWVGEDGGKWKTVGGRG